MPPGLPGELSGELTAHRNAEGMFECLLCGKTFHARRSLRQHISVHKGATRCPVCLTVLSRRAHLYRHLTAVHNMQPEHV